VGRTATEPRLRGLIGASAGAGRAIEALSRTLAGCAIDALSRRLAGFAIDALDLTLAGCAIEALSRTLAGCAIDALSRRLAGFAIDALDLTLAGCAIDALSRTLGGCAIDALDLMLAGRFGSRRSCCFGRGPGALPAGLLRGLFRAGCAVASICFPQCGHGPESRADGFRQWGQYFTRSGSQRLHATPHHTIP
jgi:hypothetical protein